jgi:hypothetical protein
MPNLSLHLCAKVKLINQPRCQFATVRYTELKKYFGSLPKWLIWVEQVETV